jgi:hypothetical protein
MGFSPKDAQNQLALNGAGNPPCPACGKTDWAYAPVFTILVGEMEGESLAEGGMGLAEPTEQAPRVVSVVCRGCGFVRMHSLSMLH